MGMNSHPRSSSSSSSSVGTDALEPADALCHIVPSVTELLLHNVINLSEDGNSKNVKMSYRSKYNETSSPEIDFTSPALAVMGVEQLLFAGRAINGPANEVWPRLYIGDMDFAENRARLGRENFTHVLNCAHSSRRGNDFYSGMGITYLGIEAHDSPAYDMSVNFNTGAEFIHNALRTGGKILVHCHVGVSRSASIVLAYLMLKHNMTLVEAINTVKKGRGIIPNRGFLRQLIDLHVKLYGYRS